MLLIFGGAAVLMGGCGSGKPPTPAASHLEREDFAAVVHALDALRGPVAHESAASKAVWPLIANGLPPSATAAERAQIGAAALRTSEIPLPGLFGEVRAATLTGPAAHLAGLFRSFRGLVTRGWQLIDAAVEASARGPSAAASFARANVALYIESVYDAHFSLAQLGKQLAAGYAKLGGASDFGTTLTQAEVDRVTMAYGEATERLHPHVGVRLGS